MAKLLPVDVFDLIIFGGTGDLAMRKLLPALYHRDRDGQFTGDSRIIAVGRGALSKKAYLAEVKEALQKNLADDDFDAEFWRSFSERIKYVKADAMSHNEWGSLKKTLAGKEERIRVIYLATAPSLFGPIAKGLATNRLITANSRIVLEKPLGRDLESASEINNQVGECFAENQIYRIDHYLGKETVQNLLALRFANSLFEPLWRRGTVDHVQITVAEELGVGGRIEFYDRVGALRDMVQNHLLQLVCLTAMEAPSSLHHDAVRDEKIKVLRALRPIDADAVRDHTVRGQYAAGAIKGETAAGYLEELGGADSSTETFVALKIEIDNWRWSNVPFYLRTGKRLKGKHSEIVVEFQDVPHSIFPQQDFAVMPNRLTIRLQPDEGVKLTLMAKEPGPGGFDLRPVSLDLSFEETFGIRYPDSYERLLMEVLRGNPALFMRRDEVDAAWQWIDGIISGWEHSRQKVESYVAGSWGPTASSVLLDRDNRAWYPDT
ncbi:MAG: glucose-6-phosphate dehydrogenase [Gammaproteobacteria bacterium]|nr:glucose-6-phosphate dehydrogenase [Gammaproteobacteria bacterium]MDH3409053.1 glucose-6-phosphate dehydrogenase [Gammaproteobacteria bacterium]MDH3551250.1 glucose-6-phosphate dehydrogenase [Gammaproteobacteria bacterium]